MTDESDSRDDSLTLPALERIDAICLKFEAIWKEGRQPRIEDYLGSTKGIERRALLRELLLLDLDYGGRSGRPPSESEYLSRFPMDGQLVSDVLTQLATDAVAVATSPATSTSHSCQQTLPCQFGEYDLLEVLGEGGMGIVYRARQETPHRIVALKIIRPDRLATVLPDRRANALKRFQAEVDAAAQLEHDNILSVYDVGEVDGQPFFSMRYVDGRGLGDVLRDGPLAGQDAARLLEPVVRALHFAHERGIVHRDVKPRNILLDREGKPYVTDFGLAKSFTAEQDLTQTAETIGTPAYMPPEQVSGPVDVDCRVDVYSLGATLYELLTGRPPFRASTPAETLHQVIDNDPVPLRQMNPAVDRDLETICLKCLQKERSRRYETAAELADELQRYLNGQPIHTRPIGIPGRVWRWCQRKPLVAGLGAAVVLLMLFVAVASPLVTLRQTTLRKEADERAEEAQHARERMEVTLVDMYTSAGLVAAERNKPDQAVLWFANAARQAVSDPKRQRANRIRVRTWSRLVPTPVRALEHDGQQLRSMQFHANGKHLLTLTKQDKCKVWDLERERKLPPPGGDRPVRSVAWSPNGRWLALGMPAGNVQIFSFPANQLLHRIEHRGAVEALAFSRDGKRLAVASDMVQVWDCQSHVLVTPELIHPRPVFALAFSANGNRLATGCADHQARVFAIEGRSTQADPLFPPVRHILRTWEWCMPIAPAFIDQDSGLLTATDPNRLTWRDAATGQQIRTVPTETEAIHCIIVSPDEQRFAAGGNEKISLWDVATSRPVGDLMPQPGHVLSASFSPDGATLIAGSLHILQTWSARDGQPTGPVIKHQAQILQTAFSPDGRFFATAQVYGLVRVWRTALGNHPDQRLPLGGISTAITLSRDGRYLIPTGSSWYGSSLVSTRVYDVSGITPAGPTLRPGGILRDSDLSPNGRHAVTLGPRKAHFWEWRTGKQIFDPVAMPSEPRAVRFTPDGRLAFVVCIGGQVLAIDPATGQVMMRLQHGAPPIPRAVGRVPGDGYLDISSDGRRFLSCSIDQFIRVCDTNTGILCYDPLEHKTTARLGRFSPDARLLLTTEEAPDSTIRIWDAATGAPVGCKLIHPKIPVSDACFSPDGQHVLAASVDGMALLWDWRTGDLVCPPFRHTGQVLSACFTPDGVFVLTADHDFTARVWEWHTGQPVTPPLALSGNGFRVITSADGRHAFVSGEASCIDVFNLDSLYRGDDLELDDLCVLGEIVSGQRIHAGGGVINLSGDEWLDRWNRFRRSHREYLRFGSAEDEVIAWHQREANSCLETGQWFAAVGHLDFLASHQPDNWRHYRDRGRAYAALGQFDRADADHARAFALIPADEARSFLKNRVADLARIDRQEHQRILADINGYLAAKSAGGLERSELDLAARAARCLERRGNTELAVSAYQGFADVIGRSRDESLSDIAKQMQGAVRRLSLVGHKIEYRGRNRDGSPCQGANFRGKVVLIHFWSTRYAKWQQEFINLKRFRQLYRSRGFEVVTVNLDQDRERVERLFKDNPVPGDVIHADDASRNHPMAVHYGIWSIPTNFLVGPDGNVLSTEVRGPQLRLWLQRLLGPPFVPQGNLAFVDLDSKANLRLDESLFMDGNDLGELAQGEQTFGGTTFRIGAGLIQLGSSKLRTMPQEVVGITIGRHFTSLYVLHGTQWGDGSDGDARDHDVIGRYHVKYDDTTEEIISIVYGRDVRNAWHFDHAKPVSRAVVAWEGRNEAVRSRNLTLRLYLTQWTNPHPEKKVTTLDFVSTNTGAAPYCVAMTLAE